MDIKQDTEHLETSERHLINVCQSKSCLIKRAKSAVDVVVGESAFSRYIPGGYSPTRCLKLSGRPMMYAILSLAGCAIMFFGYDASVMSLVNTNEDYLNLMGADTGSNRDSAAIGGLVSLWFGGFAIGKAFGAVVGVANLL